MSNEVSEAKFAMVLAGEVVVDIGQVNGLWKQMLDREVRVGRLTKWRGHWHPVAGASWGIGPLKTCYGTPATAEALRATEGVV